MFHEAKTALVGRTITDVKIKGRAEPRNAVVAKYVNSICYIYLDDGSMIEVSGLGEEEIGVCLVSSNGEIKLLR